MAIDPTLFTGMNKAFSAFIDDDGNKKIVLSGKFGSGKTSFLHHFFQDAQQNNKYWYVHLFPVNYSVSKNEDIFELLKYDLLLDFLKKGVELKGSIDNLPAFFSKDDYVKLVTTVIGMVPKVGKDLESTIAAIKKLYEYVNRKFDVDELDQKGGALADFLTELENKTGLFVEYNIISQLIYEIVRKHAADGRETVLVIDDLDRIDPDHIFRLLNVFAAHMDSSIGGGDYRLNKFGFDKIIVVCDIDNIRKIFKAKFGQDVDFSGYIDKFYSKAIFYFNNKRQLGNLVRRRLADISIFQRMPRGDHHKRFFDERKNRLMRNAEVLLLELVLQGFLPLRKLIAAQVSFHDDFVRRPVFQGVDLEPTNQWYVFYFDVITHFLGGQDEAKLVFKHFDFSRLNEDELHYLAALVIWMKHYRQNKLILDVGQSYSVTEYGDIRKLYVTKEFNDYEFMVNHGQSNSRAYFSEDQIRLLIYWAIDFTQQVSFFR